MGASVSRLTRILDPHASPHSLHLLLVAGFTVVPPRVVRLSAVGAVALLDLFPSPFQLIAHLGHL